MPDSRFHGSYSHSESVEDLAPVAHFLMDGGTIAEANNITPESLEVIYSMAFNQYQNNHFEEAARGFQYLCFYDHWNSRNFLCLGACQQMMRLFGQAIHTYFYAARLAPENPLPLAYIGDCYLALNKSDKAITAYKTAIEHASKHQFEHAEIQRITNLISTLDVNNDGGKA